VAKQAFSSKEMTELFRPCVTGDPVRQFLQSGAVAAG
jgi:hypothetical protein